MKKFILTLLVATSLFSAAPSYSWNRGGNGYHGGYNGYRGGYNNNYRGGYSNNWIAPAIGGLIVGGVVGAALASPYYSPAPVYSQPAPVYVQPEPVYVQHGTGYTPPPAPPYGYHHEQMLDNNCNCYVTILVQN